MVLQRGTEPLLRGAVNRIKSNKESLMKILQKDLRRHLLLGVVILDPVVVLLAERQQERCQHKQHTISLSTEFYLVAEVGKAWSFNAMG